MSRLDLVWTRYDKPPASKFQLIVFLGQESHLKLALLADSIPDEELKQLRENIMRVKAMDMPATRLWVKDLMPVSYSKCFRAYETTQLVELRNWGIQAI